MAPPPRSFRPQGIREDAVDVLKEIRDGLADDPKTRDAFFTLIAGYGKRGVITDGKDVSARAADLLQGHPGLLSRFHGFIDPVRRGLDFLKRAKKALVPAKYDQFVAKLYTVEEERSLDAHQVYQGFKELLAEGHDDLLQGLAEFLPRKYVPPPPPPRASAKAEREEKHRRRPERKRPSYAGADAPESSRAKKPRVVHVAPIPTPAPACLPDTGVGVAGGSRPSRARRPRPYDSEYEYDGALPERKRAKCAVVSVADGGKSSRPSRAKKPCADGGGMSQQHAALGGAARGSVPVPVPVAASPSPAPAPDGNVTEVRRFRESWEFETRYCVLDATLKRAVEVKSERERLNSIGRASLDALFPSPESQGFLARMYQEKWNHVVESLEHGGYQTAFALLTIVETLTRKDAEAVDEARRRQDPARAVQRLLELGRDKVRLNRKANQP